MSHENELSSDEMNSGSMDGMGPFNMPARISAALEFNHQFLTIRGMHACQESPSAMGKPEAAAHAAAMRCLTEYFCREWDS